MRLRVVLASFDRVPSAKGACQHILANYRHLAADYDVSLVTLGETPLNSVRHLPLHLAEPNLLRRALEFRKKVERVFEENPFDIYHVRSPWEGLAVPTGATMIYEVNGLPSIEAAYHYPAVLREPELRRKLQILEDAVLDRCTIAITPSRVTARYLEERGLPADRIAVVPNSPTIELLDSPVAKEEPATVTMAYMGTLTSWQGLDEVLSILPRLSCPWRLRAACTGSSDLVRGLRKRAQRESYQGRVEVLDPLPPSQVGAWLRGHDLGLLPLASCERNLVQGCQPLKLLDYLAAGLPVLAPDLPVVREVVGDDYPLYARYSRGAMVALLQKLLTDSSLRAALSQQGRERIRRHFSAEHQHKALLEVYRRIS